MPPLKIYLASSWRNGYQPQYVEMLRDDGHEVYDFREPEPGVTGFAWSDIDPDWESWEPRAYVEAVHHQIATDGFNRDMDALRRCDACILLLPCGRSAHLELGWAVGAGKLTAIVITEPTEPELMYRMVDTIETGPVHLLGTVRRWSDERGEAKADRSA